MAVGEPGVDEEGNPDRSRDEVYYFLGPESDVSPRCSFKVLVVAKATAGRRRLNGRC